MSHHIVLDAEIRKLLPSHLGNKTVLDVACGFGHWAYFITIYYNKKPFICGLDVWKPYLIKLQTTSLYDDLVHANGLKLPFKSRCFDFVLACEVIEHLPKLSGPSFIKEMERVCKSRLIMTTPDGFWHQTDLSTNPNPYDAHRSAWNMKSFAERGFHVKRAFGLPRTLYIVDRIRRVLLRQPKPIVEIIAWKDLN